MTNTVDLNKIAGIHVLTNTGALVLYKNERDDEGRVLVGFNCDAPEWCKVSDDEEGFFWGELFVPFSEVQRI